MYRDQVIYWGNGSVLDVICFEICTPEGRGGEKGGIANFKTKHTEPFTQDHLQPCITNPALGHWRAVGAVRRGRDVRHPERPAGVEEGPRPRPQAVGPIR